MNNGVIVSSESIERLSSNIITETQKLVQMIEQARAIAEDSKKSFDSPAARDFRTKMNEFAENAKKGTDENLNNLAMYFSAVAKTYTAQDEGIRQAENEYLSTELFG
jgi:hypothetical protein